MERFNAYEACRSAFDAARLVNLDRVRNIPRRYLAGVYTCEIEKCPLMERRLRDAPVMNEGNDMNIDDGANDLEPAFPRTRRSLSSSPRFSSQAHLTAFRTAEPYMNEDTGRYPYQTPETQTAHKPTQFQNCGLDFILSSS